MRELKMKLCVLMLPLVVSACGSTPPAPVPCVKPPAPPAWVMMPPSNSPVAGRNVLGIRDGIISDRAALRMLQEYIRTQCIN